MKSHWLLTSVFVSTAYSYLILNLNTFGVGCMQNIWLKRCTGLLACGLRLVVEGKFINFWLRVVMGFLA